MSMSFDIDGDTKDGGRGRGDGGRITLLLVYGELRGELDGGGPVVEPDAEWIEEAKLFSRAITFPSKMDLVETSMPSSGGSIGLCLDSTDASVRTGSSKVDSTSLLGPAFGRTANELIVDMRNDPVHTRTGEGVSYVSSTLLKLGLRLDIRDDADGPTNVLPEVAPPVDGRRLMVGLPLLLLAFCEDDGDNDDDVDVAMFLVWLLLAEERI
mmetsp:Transcript_1968/g.4503  ORF Transcript_1968/g.4503 Transcript_1968/m.4503 type:complete len:211 (-) Transcript_1968:167-799(-)